MTTTMASHSTSEPTAGRPTTRSGADAAGSENAMQNGWAEYARRLRQVESLLWETAERLDELAGDDQWPPPSDRLCEMAGVLIRIAVTVDVLGHGSSSGNGKRS
jgi:hypothetical protein